MGVLDLGKNFNFSLNHLHSLLVLYQVLNFEDFKSTLCVVLVRGKLYDSLGSFPKSVDCSVRSNNGRHWS